MLEWDQSKTENLARSSRIAFRSKSKFQEIVTLLENLGWNVAYTSSKSPSSDLVVGPETCRRLSSGTITADALSRQLSHRSQTEILVDTGDFIVWSNRPRSPNLTVELSKRELEVHALIVNGYTPMEISQELGIAKRTVDKHIQRIYKKLGVHSFKELILTKRQSNKMTRGDSYFK